MDAAGRERRIIEVRGLTCGYGSDVVLRDVSFDVLEGEVFGILGPSGCGKSTLLKSMIGLLEPLSGQVLVEGEDVFESAGPDRDALLRKIGVGYQQGALFASMSLRGNVALPLEVQTELPARARHRIAGLKLGMVGLAGYEDHMPSKVSVGMQKRAAIARAMALDPRIIFLDQPVADLDPSTASEVDGLIARLSRVLDTTFVLVTHSLPSIIATVDRAIVLGREKKGVVAQGEPGRLREESEDPLVRSFFCREPLEDMAVDGKETA